MRKITLCALIAFLGFGNFAIAQQTTLQILLDRLAENHMGSITSVFSSEEIEILQQHFNTLASDEPNQFMRGNKLIHATENTQMNYVEINPANTSSIQVVAPSPLAEFEGAGATIPGSQTAIVVDNANNFYEVSPSGNYEVVSLIDPGGGLSFTGLEYASDGTLYGIATNGSGDTRLFEINLSNKTATPIGGNNGLVVGIALGRDMNNNLYSYDIDTDMVHRIDRNTGMATMLGPIGFNANFGQGMGYSENEDQLLITAFNGSTFKPELRSVNTSTGASTLISTIVPSETFQFAWMSIFDPTLGSNEFSSENTKLFPNPTNGMLTISSEMMIEQIAIYNMLGQRLLQQNVSDNRIQVDVSNLQSGIYLAEIKSEQGSSSIRFVKQ